MTTSFPAAVDDYTATKPLGGSARSDPSLATNIGNLMDAVTAIENQLYLGEIQTFGREGALIVTTGKGRWYVPWDIKILDVTASVNTAPTGSTIICDIRKNGTTVFTAGVNRPTIAISGFLSATVTPDVTAVMAGQYLQVDIVQIGSTVVGSDLVVQIRYRKT